MNEYEKQAVDFLKKNNIRFTFDEPEIECPDWDNYEHFKFHCVFYNRNTRKRMTVNFYSSRQDYFDGKDTVSAYDVLACLQKYDVGSMDDFVSEFGYEIHSYKDFKRLEKTYKAVCREVKGVQRVFADCMEDLQEIA